MSGAAIRTDSCASIPEANLEQRLDVVESMIAKLSPALAVHTGPGTVGLCNFPVVS
jgi:fatty acid-binding protein DegV